jgi:glucose dehydrogenase
MAVYNVKVLKCSLWASWKVGFVVNFNFTTRSPTYLFFGEGIVVVVGFLK